jgi:hypothetical protein
VWLNEPLVPFTVTVYVPVLAVLATFIVSVDVPDPPETWVGLKVAVRPDGADAESVTVPVNPFTDAIVIVEVPEYPLLMLNLVGDADIVKSAVGGGGADCVKFVVSGLPKPVT